jgi:hypothetical protein
MTVKVKETIRTDREQLAARIRAARATKTFRSYYKPSQNLNANCHTFHTFKQKEILEVCNCRSCKEPAVKRIAVNVWGSVCEADVCEKHAELNGKWVDSI